MKLVPCSLLRAIYIIFIFLYEFELGSKIAVDGDRSHKIRRWLLLGRKAMTNIDNVLKSGDITLPTKVYGLLSGLTWLWELDCTEGRAPKNWGLQTVVLRRPLRVPWTARRSNQSILRKINPEYSLGGLMLKLKPQYFGYLMWTVDSLEKSLVLGNIEGRERRGHQRMSWLDGITEAMGMNLGKLWETVRNRETGMLQSMGSQIQTRLGDWTKTIKDSVLVLKMHFLLFLLCYSKRNYIIKLILCSFGRGF